MFGLSPRGVAGCGVGEGGPCGGGAGGNGPTGIGRPWPPIVPAEQPSWSLLFVGPTFEYRLHEPPLPGECVQLTQPSSSLHAAQQAPGSWPT